MKKIKLSENNSLIAMFSAMAAGLLIHMFGLVNILHNYDSIAVLPNGYGTGITSGRWLLNILGDLNRDLFGGDNIAWFEGIIGILFLSAAVYLLIKIFNIRSRMFSVLLGIGFIAFPSVASCMLFRFTSTFYALAVLMSVLAAYIVIRGNKKYMVLRIILSGLLSAGSLGIYQAYLPVTASIFVLYLIQQTLQNKKDWKGIMKQSLMCLLCLILGLVLYFVILKIALLCYDTALSNYQNINSMGKMSFRHLIKLLLMSFTGFFAMPFKNTYALAPFPVMTVIYLVWDVFCAAVIVMNLVKRKAAPMQWVTAIILCICFPMAVNLLVVMCSNSWIYTLMVYSFVMVLFMPAVVFEALPEPSEKYAKCHRLTAGLLAVTIGIASFCYTYAANVTYTAQYYANRRMENLTSSIMTQVRSTENYRTELPWAFIGVYNDPSMTSLRKDAPVFQGWGSTKGLVNSYSLPFWFKIYEGNYIMMLDDDARDALAQTEEVRNMPCWPSNGSVQIIHDTVVVKFGEPEADNKP